MNNLTTILSLIRAPRSARLPRPRGTSRRGAVYPVSGASRLVTPDMKPGWLILYERWNPTTQQPGACPGYPDRQCMGTGIAIPWIWMEKFQFFGPVLSHDQMNLFAEGSLLVLRINWASNQDARLKIRTPCCRKGKHPCFPLRFSPFYPHKLRGKKYIYFCLFYIFFV